MQSLNIKEHLLEDITQLLCVIEMTENGIGIMINMSFMSLMYLLYWLINMPMSYSTKRKLVRKFLDKLYLNLIIGLI